MFGKLENGRLVLAGQKIQIGNVWITNPTEEQLRNLGYKEVEYTERPTYDKENEKLTETYTDGATIVVSYEKVALTDYEHNEIIKQEIADEEAKISARNIRESILGDSFALNKITETEGKIAELREKLRVTNNEE